jgi:Uma2 family endonuclease
MTAIPLDDNIDYPDAEAQPTAESSLHLKEITNALEGLEQHFQDMPDAFVAAHLPLYYEQGDPEAVVTPDLFVVEQVEQKERRKYLLWEEEVAPSCVLELTSRNRGKKDLGVKKELYERLGVGEYFLFDPYREFLTPPLQGFRLTDGRYRPIRHEPDGSLVSLTLGVVLTAAGKHLRLTDVATGSPLLDREESEELIGFQL